VGSSGNPVHVEKSSIDLDWASHYSIYARSRSHLMLENLSGFRDHMFRSYPC